MDSTHADDGAGALAPSGLLVALRRRPLGAPRRGFRLSWIVPTLVPGARQSAYQLQVWSGPPEPGGHARSGPAWDSGRVDSDASVAVRYTGPVLEPASPYWWRVRTWVASPGHAERRSEWSSSQFLITEAAALGAPIWAPAVRPVPSAAPDRDAVPDWCLLRTEFDLPDTPVEVAFVQATGQSPAGAFQYVYKLWLNGGVVGRGPVRSIGEETRYQTHDVTPALRPGRNAMAALCYTATDHRFAARLVVCFSDGRRQEVVTSSAWRAQAGSALLPFQGFTGGGHFEAPKEYWDMGREPIGWKAPAFDDQSWAPAVVGEPFEVLATAPVDLEETNVDPASVIETSPGVWRVDFGREIVGSLRVVLDGRARAAIGVGLGEELDGDRVRSHLRTGNDYEEVWTLRPGQQEIEHWGYRGFRWAELVMPPGESTAPSVTATALHSHWEDEESDFECSDPDLTTVWNFARYSVKALDFDLYQDTPTRERKPYEGDALINQRCDYAVQRQFALARYSNGYLCQNPEWPTEFHLMSVLTGWEDYLATGDEDQLALDYQSYVAKNLDGNVASDGLIHKEPGVSGFNTDVVDWPASCRDGYEFTDVNTVVNAFQFAAYAALAKVAGVLGYIEDGVRYTDRAERLRATINSRLLAPEGEGYLDGLAATHRSQQATAFPIALGVPESAHLPALGDYLASGGIRCSPYGVQFLLDGLFLAGRADAAHALLVGTGLCSWLHMIRDLGATTTMECWDPSLKPNTTFSHIWGAAPVNVIARYVLGVKVVSPGAAELEIYPQPGPLRWMRGTVPTIRGPVSVELNREDGFCLRLITPANSTTRLVIDPAALGVESASVAVDTGGPVPIRSDDGRVITFNGIGAGTTTLTGEPTPPR